MNFTVAARELYISQPALSKQIRLLEEELDVRLFNRDTRQVHLTEGGKILYQEWSDMIQRSERAIGAARNAQTKKAKTIRVGILEFGGVIGKIAPILDAFMEEDSNMEVLYEVHGFSQLRKMLDDKEVDLIFTMNTEVPVSKHEILQKSIYDLNLCIVVPPKNKYYEREELKITDLRGETIYLFSDEYSKEGRSSIMTHFAREGVPIHKVKEFSNIRSMAIALTNGAGVTIGYKDFFEQTEKLKFFPIKDEIGHHQLVAAWKIENENQVHELMEFASFIPIP